MADQDEEHGPWEKYGGGTAVAAPEAEHGPWEKYGAPTAAPKTTASVPTEAQALAKPPVAPMPKPIKMKSQFDMPADLQGKEMYADTVAPAGAAASIPRAVGGVVAPYAANWVADKLKVKNLWMRDAAVLGSGLLGEGIGVAAEDAAAPLKRATIEAPDKIRLPGGFKINRNIPVPPEETAYQNTKTITEAQEAALGENKKFDVRSQKAQQQTAAQRDAAYEKEGQEQMAIQERYDQAQKARVAAEKDVKNSQLKQEQAHEKAMKEIETSRQKELAAQEKLRNLDADARQKRGGEQGKLDDAHAKNMAAAEKEASEARAATERLRTQHGSDLMKRQAEHDALVKAASKASEDENVAKAEVVKGSSTPSAAKPKNGVLRVPIKSGSFPNNPAGNIQNVPRDLLPGIIQRTGDPAAVNEFSRTTNTPALYVPESYAAPREYTGVEPKNGNGLKFSTDKVGVRWAENPDGVRVSIPKNMPSEEVPIYASEKMGEQIKLRAQHGIASNGEDGIVGVNEEPASKTRINGSGGGNGSLEEQRRAASETEKGVKYFVEHLKAPGKSRVEISSGTANSDFRPGPGKRIIRVDKNGESIFR